MADLHPVDEAWFTAAEKISILADALERLEAQGASPGELDRVMRLSGYELDELIRQEATSRTVTSRDADAEAGAA